MNIEIVEIIKLVTDQEEIYIGDRVQLTADVAIPECTILHMDNYGLRIIDPIFHKEKTIALQDITFIKKV